MPQPLELGFAKAVGRSAQLDFGAAKDWSANCRIHRACPPLPRLPPCARELAPLDAFGDETPDLAGRGVVAFRGQIKLASSFTTAVACWSLPPLHTQPCCNGTGMNAILLVGDTALELQGRGCAGDESRDCCDVPAFDGVEVIAFGVLSWAGSSARSEWLLKNAQLCTDSAHDKALLSAPN